MTGRALVSVRGQLERVLHAVERWQVLDGPGYELEHGIALTYLLAGRAARPLQDLLHGVWLGHPLHTDHAGRSPEPRRFISACAESDLVDGEPVGVDVDGVPVVLVARDGEVRAVGGVCPHQGAPLGEGWLHRGELVCPWHGSRFDLDAGEPAQGPSTAPLPCFDTRLTDGRVEVRRRASWRGPDATTTREEASR